MCWFRANSLKFRLCARPFFLLQIRRSNRSQILMAPRQHEKEKHILMVFWHEFFIEKSWRQINFHEFLWFLTYELPKSGAGDDKSPGSSLDSRLRKKFNFVNDFSYSNTRHIWWWCRVLYCHNKVIYIHGAVSFKSFFVVVELSRS